MMGKHDGPSQFSELELAAIRRQISQTVGHVMAGLARPDRPAFAVVSDIASVFLALCIAWTLGVFCVAVAQTKATLGDVEELREAWRAKDAKAQELLQQLDAIRREQAPPANPNRMTPNAGQVSSL